MIKREYIFAMAVFSFIVTALAALFAADLLHVAISPISAAPADTLVVIGIELRVDEPLWIVSQIFAFFALIFTIWAWQVKNKVRMMMLVGLFSAFLAFSATLLANFTLGVLFGLAAIRNFVFCYLDMKVEQGIHVPKRIPYTWAAVFATATITSTVILVHILQVPRYAVWLEWLICLTLLGLIAGNVMKGTNLMRVSFISNRVFNIINHAYFNNVIAVIIAICAIGSNLVFYLREFIAWMKERKTRQME
jgi:hypothetical protein